MQKFSLDNDLKPNVEDMWALLLDAEFQRRIHVEGLHFREYRVESQEERDGVVHRRAYVMPKVDMPGPLTKLLGDSMSYYENVRFDRAAKHWRWDLDMSGPGSKIKVGGHIELLAGRGGFGCVRRTHFEVEAKIFGVGGLIEKTVKKETLSNYELAATFINANT